MRPGKRKYNELRKIKIVRNYLKNIPGSVFISFGDTKVVCSASINCKVPMFLKDKNHGWLTAEYGMLPCSSDSRISREAARGKQGGRTLEIQRLIGRSLRCALDMTKLGNHTIWIDCDVIQADGGTRTASITGAMIALDDAIRYMLRKKMIEENPIKEFVAAVSVGIVNSKECLDLCYEEDSSADVDMNIVMTEKGKFIELQGTAEGLPFNDTSLAKMIRIGKLGIKKLIRIQKQSLKK